MYVISRKVYADLARQVCERLEDCSYFSGEITCDDGVAEHRFLATLIIYRKRAELLGQEFDTISDVVPVWWECRSVTEGGEVLNDFDFGQFKREMVVKA